MVRTWESYPKCRTLGYVFCVYIEYFVDFPPLISGVGVERRAGRTKHLLGAGGFTWKPRNPRRVRLQPASAGVPGLKEEGENVGIIFVGLVARHARLSVK